MGNSGYFYGDLGKFYGEFQTFSWGMLEAFMRNFGLFYG